MTDFIDLHNYLNFPFAYLLQKYSIEDLSHMREENQYSLLHCAVLNNNVSKVIEIINTQFPLNALTDTSEIPFNLIKKYVPFDFTKSLDIIFSNQGYTALHLNLFLLNYYTHFKPQKKSFTIEQFYNEQLKILHLFLEKDTQLIGLTDKKGLSLFDYAFLFENVFLINKFFLLDPTFSYLSGVEKHTALKILETIKIKEKNNITQPFSNEKINDDMFSHLKKIILYDKLTVDLYMKNKLQSVNKI